MSPFGSYQCRVNATGVVFTQQLTIKEKGMCMFVTIIIIFFFLVVSLRLELNIKESLRCSKDDVRGLFSY